MTLFSIDVQKTREGLYWTNRYISDALSLAEADGVALALCNYEKQLYYNGVTINKRRVSTLAAGDVSYIATPMAMSGTRSISTATLPKFCTLRLDAPAGTGRPSRKFYRDVLTEADVDGDSLNSGAITAFAAIIDDLNDIVLVDPQGEELDDWVIYPYVQMRQMRRGSRRRTEPII